MIKSNNRIALFGKTGSGKTVIVKYVLWPQYGSRKIFFDPKCRNRDIGGVLVRNPDQLAQVVGKDKPILYQPDDLSQDDFDEVCGIIFEAGNYTLFMDEITDVCSSNSISPKHKRLLAQGRELGIGVVSCSTRPMNISSYVFSESEHFFVFSLFLEGDVAKIKTMLPSGIAKRIYTLPPHHFLYFNTSGDVRFFKPFNIRGL